jgi:hypothetical protein
MKDTDILIQIKELELSILSKDTRKSSEKLHSLIDDNFMEFGVSGFIYNKEEVINSLPNEISRDFVIDDLEVALLSENIALVTYKIKESSILSLRSSVWKRSGNLWKLIFHQGTKVQEK